MSYFEDVEPSERNEFTPTQALLASVLEIALQDFARPGESARVRRNRSNAWRWLFGAPLEGSGLDFEKVCEALNLQPDAVRKLVLAGRVQLYPMAGRPSSRRRHRAITLTDAAELPKSPCDRAAGAASPAAEALDDSELPLDAAVRAYGT